MLISIEDATLAFGAAALLEGASVSIERGDKLALVGRNGAGKSTLLSVLKGEIQVDDGVVRRDSMVRIADVPQNEERSDAADITTFIQESVADHHEAWEFDRLLEKYARALSIDTTASPNALSGGQWRRVLLMRALIAEPDLLILDEPTNHLDIAGIEWLEGHLRASRTALVITSHDRMFLRNVVKGVLDLDRGRLTRWDVGFDQYIDLKAAALADEAKTNAEFDKKLAEEERWIRKGIQARRTRNMGRVRDLKKMRVERRARRDKQGNVKLVQSTLEKDNRSGKRVIVGTGLTHHADGRALFTDFNCEIRRGDRVGIIGPNGVGKTTLLRVLLGQLTADAGSVEHGTKLEIGYFDQHRAQLNPKYNAIDNVADGRDSIIVGGKPLHIMSYMQRFLFTPERARSPIDKLSGGERHRLLLAKLLSQQFNVLVMDEPTNDLDVETLELLEEWLMEYDGTVLLVSHDRAFLDNCVTSLWAFDGHGGVEEHIGGYTDWYERTKTAAKAPTATTEAVKDTVSAGRPNSAPPAKKAVKLSYNEQRELDGLPHKIEELEGEIETLTAQTMTADFYQQDEAIIKAHASKVEALQQTLDTAMERWESLEEKVSGAP